MKEKYNLHISIVVPTYKGEASLPELYNRLKNTLEKITSDFEIILVNDYSPQKDWEVIKQLGTKDERVKGINLSRNFGQHFAITAGLEASKGEWIVVMDCDLQDKPEEIIKLYNKAQEGCDIVLAKRIRRTDNFFKKLFSKIFYAVLGYITNTKQDSSIGNFGIYNKKVIDSVCSMKDSIRYFPTMIRWVGYKYTSVPVEHAESKGGKTSYTFKKLVNLALDVMLAFSDKPLKLTVKIGLTFSILAIIFTIINIIRYLKGDIEVLGWTSLVVSIWFLSGMIIFVLGVVGLYVGKTFEKVKDRPLYIVSEKINID